MKDLDGIWYSEDLPLRTLTRKLNEDLKICIRAVRENSKGRGVLVRTNK